MPLIALVLLGSVALAQPVQRAAGPPKLLVLEPRIVNVDKSDAQVLQRLIVQEASRAKGLDVVAQSDLAQLAALAGDKASAGCDNDACMAEIAAALGAELVVFGEVGKLGGEAVLQLTLFDAARSKALARETVEAANVPALGARVPPTVRRLLRPLADAGRIELAAPSPLFVTGVAATVTGAAAFAVGAAALVVAAVVVPSAAFATPVRAGLQKTAPAFVVVAGAGLAVGATGAVLWALAPE